MEAIDIPGWMSEHELDWLHRNAKDHHYIIEIGSYLGRSTRALASGTPGFVVAIDDWYGPRDMALERPDRNVFTSFMSNVEGLDVRPIRINYNDLFRMKLWFTPDMIFIDGDHRYASVLRDIRWSMSVMRQGFLCGHDIDRPDVKEAVMKSLPAAKVVCGSIWAVNLSIHYGARPRG